MIVLSEWKQKVDRSPPTAKEKYLDSVAPDSLPNLHCIIVNPHAGRKRAVRRLEAYRRHILAGAKVLETQGPGQARGLALQAVKQGFQTIVAAGGDGTVHEVACGLLEADQPDVRLGVIPIGSANDFAWSLERETSRDGILRVDAGRIEDQAGRVDYFVESVGVGLSGQVTQASRGIGWLQGMPLYMLAAIQAIWRMRPQSYRLTLDDQQTEADTTLLSLMLGKREGSFVMAPDASMCDGKFDYVHAFGVGRLEAMGLLPRIALAGPPKGHAKILLGRATRARVESDRPLVIHTDGELFAVPSDRVHQVSIELLPRKLQVVLIT